MTGENIKNTSDKLISAGLNKSTFTIRQNRGSLTIRAVNSESYELIKNKLIELKEQFYSYTPREVKPHSIALKNIFGDYRADDIKNDLNKLKLNINITKVIPIECKKSRYKKQHFIIQLTSNSIKKELTQIKNVVNQDARWEHLIKKKTTQCTNCQRIGHTSSQCNMQYRCMKCGESHERGKCTITSDEEDNRDKLTCANCGQKGHPASYAGCIFRIFADRQKKLDILRNTNQDNFSRVKNKSKHENELATNIYYS